MEDFVAKLRELVERGHSEDIRDTEYEKTALQSLKKWVKSEVVYGQILQLLQIDSNANFEKVASHAITTDQELSLRNPRKSTAENNLVEQFSKLLNLIESKSNSQEQSTKFHINSVSTNNAQSHTPINSDSLHANENAPQSIPQIVQQNSSSNGSNQVTQRQKVCFKCGKPGHFKNRCPEKSRLNYPQHYPPFFPNMHSQYMYPMASPNQGQGFQQFSHFPPTNMPINLVPQQQTAEKCGLCGLTGHTPTVCPRNQSSTSGTSEICQLFDAVGHTAKNCPTLQGNSLRSAQ